MSRNTGMLSDNLGLVEVSVDHNSEILQGSTSGILIDASQRLFLTHASLFNNLSLCFEKSHIQQLQEHGILTGPVFQKQPEFFVVLPKLAKSRGTKKWEGSTDKTISTVPIRADKLTRASHAECDEISCDYYTYKATLQFIFECKNLRAIFNKLMPRDAWTFHEDQSSKSTDEKLMNKNNNQNTEEVQRLLLPCFALLKIQSSSKLETWVGSSTFSIINSADIKQGDRIEIVATPFGHTSPDAFLNSKSNGIISNVAGERNVLLMTDARCVPGCEGGALLSHRNGVRSLAGVVVASLCWNNNACLGLSMVCAASEIMECLGNLPIAAAPAIQCIRPGKDNSNHGVLPMIKGLVPCIRVGASWGSAVQIVENQSIYLTCSHVIKGAGQNNVKLCWPSSRQKPSACSIVYKTPAQNHFDLALLQIPSISKRGATCSVQLSSVEEGELIYVVGHAVFNPVLDLQPTITMGIVSKVIKYGNVPVMIQTTCAVHSGTSGGGVFNMCGHLVGLVVCNSRDDETGTVYPHINMAVPIETIEPIINRYLMERDPDVLQELHMKSPKINQIWNLNGRQPRNPLKAHL